MTKVNYLSAYRELRRLVVELIKDSEDQDTLDKIQMQFEDLYKILFPKENIMNLRADLIGIGTDSNREFSKRLIERIRAFLFHARFASWPHSKIIYRSFLFHARFASWPHSKLGLFH